MIAQLISESTTRMTSTACVMIVACVIISHGEVGIASAT
jgi:hypothetical protein